VYRPLVSRVRSTATSRPTAAMTLHTAQQRGRINEFSVEVPRSTHELPVSRNCLGR